MLIYYAPPALMILSRRQAETAVDSLLPPSVLRMIVLILLFQPSAESLLAFVYHFATIY